MACAVGLFLAEVTRRLLVAAAPASIPRLADVSLDWHVLGFAAIVSLATGLGFGLLPAWQAGRARPVDALRSSERVVAGTWVMKWRNALMVVEVALSAILLTGAGLMLKSLVILNGVELGFQPEHVLTANVNLPRDALSDRRRSVPLLRRARRPPVDCARRGIGRVCESLPAARRLGNGSADRRRRRARAMASSTSACQAVSPGYFQTLGIPLLRGRLLTPADTAANEPVAVVSDEFSRRYLSGGDPIGHRVRRGDQSALDHDRRRRPRRAP